MEVDTLDCVATGDGYSCTSTAVSDAIEKVGAEYLTYQADALVALVFCVFVAAFIVGYVASGVFR